MFCMYLLGKAVQTQFNVTPGLDFLLQVRLQHSNGNLFISLSNLKY